MDPCSSNSCCSMVICLRKKKNPPEILPMIGFLTVPYDPILSMFGHSNLIIWVLPLYLYIITFFLASITQTKGETQTFRMTFTCCKYEWHALGKGGSESHPCFKILHSPKRSQFFIKRRSKSPYIYSSFLLSILHHHSFLLWPTNMLNSPHRKTNER